MFGPVTAADLHDKLVAAGVAIDRKRIQLHTPVKTLGKHTVKVKLHADVSVELSFDVVSENPIEPSAEEKAAEEKKNRKAGGQEVALPAFPPTIAEGCPERGVPGRPSAWPTRRATPRSEPVRRRSGARCRTASRRRSTCSRAA